MNDFPHFVGETAPLVRDSVGVRELHLSAVKGPTEDFFGDVSSFVLSGTNEDQLLWVLSRIRSALNLSYAFVGELAGSDWNRVDVVALDTEGGRGENFSYDLAKTPCEDVLTASACVYPRNVISLFPEDHLLQEMGIESYAGLPLFDSGGRPLGLIVLLGQHGMSNSLATRVVAALRSITKKAASVLQTRRDQRDLECLVRSTGFGNNEDALQRLIEEMNSCLMTTGGFVSPVGGPSAFESTGVMRATVANFEVEEGVWATVNAGLREPQLVKGGISTSTSGVVERSQCTLLVPLYGSDDQVIGVAGLWHNYPLSSRLEQQPIVKAFGVRMSLVLRGLLSKEQQQATERRVRELERVESVGILAGGIAHDFNNLLVGVLGNSDYLLHLDDMNENGDLRETVADIRAAAVSASQLCRQLMSYASRSNIESQVFDLSVEIEEVGRLATTTLGVACSFGLDVSAGPLLVAGDPLQIRQVVLNLVTNARDAVDDNGIVNVSVQPVLVVEATRLGCDLEPLAPGSYAILTVTDNGVGMSEEVVSRIFDPFFSTKPGGYGLGLASVRNTLHAHDGRMEVVSTPGVGTSFNMYFPLAVRDARAERKTSAGEAVVETRELLLIIDDDPSVRKLLCRFASRAGFDTLVAEDGHAGLRLYLEHQKNVSLVVLDLSMPEMDGYETLSRLRLIDADVRVLISSGNRGAEVDAPLLEKPYTYKDFERFVLKTMNRKEVSGDESEAVR